MTTRERIHAEIANIPEENLEDLYLVVQQFATARTDPSAGILARLRGVRIEAPPDFSANLDVYLSGERRVDESLH